MKEDVILLADPQSLHTGIGLAVMQSVVESVTTR